MRLLYVVQRYGAEVAGGAEQHCRHFATRLARLGHQVEVLTSRATDARSWDNAYPPGSSVLDGVTVHRLSTPGPRSEALMDELSRRVLYSGQVEPPALAEAWVRAQGPVLTDLEPWLSKRAARYDVVIFFTYLFFPTWAGLRVTGGLAPTVLHATAHDEPPFWLPLYESSLRAPSAYAWSTEEERDLLRRRGLGDRLGAVIGVGMELGATVVDAGRFRLRHGLGERPYLLALGRVAPEKGSTDLARWFATYKDRRPGPLALVFVGEAAVELPPHPDIVSSGFVGEDDLAAALAGALALVQPSYRESFSMVLAEAWAAGKPALVQGRSPVLAAQARRSAAALVFSGVVEFGAAVDLLLDQDGLADNLGRAGRRYVNERYGWPAVLGRYLRLLGSARLAFTQRGGRPRGAPRGSLAQHLGPEGVDVANDGF